MATHPTGLSASAKVTGETRNVGTVPSYVNGPASRACGGCHRAAAINEDDAGKLIAFNQHTKQGGFMVEAGDNPTNTLRDVINQVVAFFK